MLPFDRISTGKLGFLCFPENWILESNRFQVFQVVDANNMLLTIDEKIYWIKGVSTQNVVNDSKVTLNQLFYVNGTKRYSTALGGSNTIFVLEAVHFTPKALQSYKDDTKKTAILSLVGEWLNAQLQRAQKREEAENLKQQQLEKEASIEAARWRVWTKANGTTIGKARFMFVINGKVKLKTADGKFLLVPVKDLKAADQEWIRKRTH